MENVRHRTKVEFIRIDDTDKTIKQQSKLTFIVIHKYCEKYDNYTFKQNEVLMEKPIYLGFSVLELSKLLMYETYFDIIQPYFKQENIQLQNRDTDCFALSVNTKDNFKDIKNIEDVFDFRNLNENHELFSNKNKKVIGKLELWSRENVCIDEFVYLRSKMYAFKCVDDSKIKLKSISKSQLKNIKFEEKKILDGEKYQEECNKYTLRSIKHEMPLQEMKKATLSIFDDKRCYIKNFES